MEEYRVTSTSSGARLDKELAKALPFLTRSRLQHLIKEGYVVTTLGNIITDPSHKIKAGETYLVQVPPPSEAMPYPQEIPLQVVFEDEDLLVIDKPAGLVVHPGAGNHQGTMVNGLLAYCGEDLSGIGGVKRPGIVHRIDKETSGLLVVAKNDRAHQGLSIQFAAHSVLRTYHALIWGIPHPPQGKIVAPIGRHPRDRQKMAVVTRNGKEAITHYHVLGRFKTLATLVACHLETGRTHQIRVHMTHIGHPLVSDPLYTIRHRFASDNRLSSLKELPWYGKRQALHAKTLGFIHPRTGEELFFESPYPEDFEQTLAIFQSL